MFLLYKVNISNNPEEWMLSSLVPIFKGKGDTLIQAVIGE